MSYLGLRTWDPCEAVSPNFYDLNSWDCMDWSQMTWDCVNQPLEYNGKSIRKRACQRHLVGVAISARLNGLRKTLVSLPHLTKYLPVSASFVPLLWALFLPLDAVNATMAVVEAGRARIIFGVCFVSWCWRDFLVSVSCLHAGVVVFFSFCIFMLVFFPSSFVITITLVTLVPCD